MSVTLVSSAQVTVATSGTEQRLVAANVDKVVALYLSTPSTNTLAISVGGTNVSTTIGVQIEKSNNLTILAPDGGYLDIYNMWVDAGTSGDKVCVSYLVKNN